MLILEAYICFLQKPSVLSKTLEYLRHHICISLGSVRFFIVLKEVSFTQG